MNSRPTIHSMEQMLEATHRAEEHHFWFRGLRRTARLLLNQALNGRSISRIIDCGAGTGRNLDWLSDYGTAIGVELSPVGLRAGRAARRRMVRGSVAALPVPSGAFDLATSFDVLYCLDDTTETRAYSEMWRVLRPDGLVLVNVAALDVLKGAHSALTGEVRRYTRATLERRLRAAGFRVERMTFTNLTPFPFALAVRTFERLSGRAHIPSERDLQVPSAPVNAVFDAALSLEAAIASRVDLPIGTSIMAVARKVSAPPRHP